MFQLRGLGEDCAANPNDPVCRAFYGTDAQPLVNAIPAFYMNQPKPDAHTPSVPAPSTQTTPGTQVTFVGGSKPWYLTWWGIGAIALAGVGLWKYSRPRKPPGVTTPAAVPAGGTAGLFGVPMNASGLSYYRWLQAAGVRGGGNTSHYSAWKRDQDPAEWRAGR